MSDQQVESTEQWYLTDEFDAKDRLGYCEDAERDHLEEDVVECLDGETYICYWCEKKVAKYV